MLRGACLDNLCSFAQGGKISLVIRSSLLSNLLNFKYEQTLKLWQIFFSCLLPFPVLLFVLGFSTTVFRSSEHNRTWNEYKRRFGNLSTEFWIGKSIYLAKIQVLPFKQYW